LTSLFPLETRHIYFWTATEWHAVLHPANVNVAPRLYRSTDNGENWTPTAGPIPSTNAAFAVMSDGVGIYLPNDSLFRSTDEGATWTSFAASPFKGLNAPSHTPSKLQAIGTVLFGADEQYSELQRSTDGGKT